MNYNIQTPFRVRWSSERGDRQQRNDPEQSASSVRAPISAKSMLCALVAILRVTTLYCMIHVPLSLRIQP